MDEGRGGWNNGDRIGVKASRLSFFGSADIQDEDKPLTSGLFRKDVERIRLEGKERREGICHAVDRNRQHGKEEHKGESTISHDDGARGKRRDSRGDPEDIWVRQSGRFLSDPLSGDLVHEHDHPRRPRNIRRRPYNPVFGPG